jgi:hypothetical protein
MKEVRNKSGTLLARVKSFGGLPGCLRTAADGTRLAFAAGR